VSDEAEKQALALAQRLRERGVHATPYYGECGLGMWIPLDKARELLKTSGAFFVEPLEPMPDKLKDWQEEQMRRLLDEEKEIP
jgi:hypothetical protein